MELAITNVTHGHRILSLPVHRRCHQRPFSSKPIYFPKTRQFSPLTSIRATFPNPNYETPKPQMLKTLNPNPISFLKTTFIAGITVTAIFFSHFTLRPAICVPISAPPTPAAVENTDSVSTEDEDEKTLELHLSTHPEDAEALKTLMELKIKNSKVDEAIGLVDQLINLEPHDSEWPLLKSHLHTYRGDHEPAKLGFEEIISKDPLRVEAYHGLVMAASGKESPNELILVEKRIIEAMEICEKEKKMDDVRDFKLLLAQIRVIIGDHNNALEIYQELCKEEPRDFRPYLCQGIIYTLLGKNDDAEKNFQIYKRLVPKEHPYTKYFDENLIATKVFAQKTKNESAFSKS